MSVASKAVFLSYAHEDGEAARQLAEALRAVDVEVWFDQSELRGGDAWDRKLKRQIKECALFVPVVSQNTQARTEGHFRLEWRHAEQRTHLMGKNAAFIVPVCIDGTKDEEAEVPDAFLEVQWMRMRKDPDQGTFEALELSDFALHVKNLIACGDIQFTPAPFCMSESPLSPGTPASTAPASTPERLGRRVPAAVWVAVVVVIAAALGYFAFTRKDPDAGAGKRSATAEKNAPPN